MGNDAVVWQFIGSGVLGAFLGSLFIHFLTERNRKKEEKRKLSSALNVVRYELIANKTSISLLLEDPANTSVGPLTDHSFRLVQLRISRELPAKTMNKLATVYLSLPVFKASAYVLRKDEEKNKDRINALNNYVKEIDNVLTLISRAMRESGYVNTNMKTNNRLSRWVNLLLGK